MNAWAAIPFFILVAGLVAFGAWHVVKGLPRLLRSNPELAWKTADGDVIESYIAERDEAGGLGGEARLEYRYRVGDIEFIGSKVGPLTNFYGLRWSAEVQWNRYPRGSKVTVYFNPRNPGEAVLEPADQKGAALLVTLAGFFWWLFAILLVACR
jgi:hypothetical protein